MDQLHNNIQKLIELMGFNDFSVSLEPESNRFLIFINDGDFLKNFLPNFVADFDYVVKLMAKKIGAEMVVVDINNYRRERENLILELARAAARKAAATKQEVALPTMNAYERRLIHMELASHPDIKTESAGEGRDRYVAVKPIE
ncbi:MAG: R3H domain-containing nucleic acid-binding protein [Patescibacteria group bacterium]